MTSSDDTRALSRLKVVAFDLGDTLVEYEGLPLSWEAHYGEALTNLAKFLGVVAEPLRLEAGRAVLRRFNTRLQPRIHEVAFREILHELLTCLHCANAGIDEEAAAVAFFQPFRQRLRCFADAPAALARLKANGLSVALFTDVPYGMPRALVLRDIAQASLEDLFDVLLTSGDVGFRKPSPVTLRALSEQCGCAPSEMAYVGNEQKDVEAALSFGCAAILVDRAGHGRSWGQHRTLASLTGLSCGAFDDRAPSRSFSM